MNPRHLPMMVCCLVFICLGLPSLGQSKQPDPQSSFYKAAQKTLNIQTQVTTGLVQSILPTDTGVLYHGTTLGSSNLLFRRNGVDFAAAESEMGSAGVFPLVFPAAQTRKVTAKAPTGGVTNIFHGQRSWLGLPNYGTLGYEQLYAGIDASFSADSRRLKQSFRVAAQADLTKLAWTFPNAQIDVGQDGHLRIRYQGRTMVLGGLAATQGAKNLSADWSFSGNTVSVSVTDYRNDQPLQLNATLVFDDYFDDFASTPSQQSTYLTGSVASLFDSSNQPTTDIMVAELGPNQQTTRFLTIIGGGQADAGTALVVSKNQRIYVAGQSASNDLPLTHGQPAGRKDAVIVCLSQDGSQVGSGLFVGGQGDDEAQTILELADGQLFVAGQTASANFPLMSAGPNFKTAFPRFPVLKPSQYFAATIDASLTGLQTSAVVTGPQLHLPLAAAMVGKVPCIGIQALFGHRSDHVCYTMNEFDEDYTLPSDNTHLGFGYYGLLWKKYRVIGTHTYSPSGALATGTVPIHFNLDPFYDQAGTLNVLENTPTVFAPDDPGGVWQYDSLLSVTDRVLANIFWLSRWKTPIFTQHALNTSTTEDVAIRELCVESTDAAYPEVGDLCDLTVDLFADITCAGSLFTYFDLHSWQLARWTETSYIPHEEMLWPLGAYPFIQHYIYDPPAGDEAAGPLILEAVRQLRQRLTTVHPVDIVDYQQGRVAKTSSAQWRVKVAALHP